MMRTVSPGFAWFCSSCSIKFLHLLDNLTKLRVCGTRVTVRTTIVLFMVLETTSPVRVLRMATSRRLSPALMWVMEILGRP